MKKSYLFIFFLFMTTAFHAQNSVAEQDWGVVNGVVHSIVKEGNTVYIGGNFTKVLANTPNGAALSTSTGQANLAFAKPNGGVYATAPDGSGGWYIGGGFTTVGGQPRNRLARINSDGTLHPWNPDVNSNVQAIAVSGSTIYIGGGFTAVGGQTRNRLAAIDATTGLATGWNPNVNNYVWAIALNGTTVYAGGEFTAVGGLSRNYIAAIDAATSLASSWNPNANNPVLTMALSGGMLYTGGNFSAIGGQARNGVAAINATTGLAAAWNPNATYGAFTPSIYTITPNGNTIYVGGMFAGIGGQARNNIAAINATTGLATTWNPNADSFVQAIAIDGAVVYAGGGFTAIGGQQRSRIAAIDASTGLATGWNADTDNSVLAIAVNGATLYAGGVFGGTAAQPRSNIAAFDATTGVLTSWNPSVNGAVLAVALGNGSVYIGGSCTTVGGQTRNNIAAIDAATGTVMAWNPNANAVVETIAVQANTVYAGGGFSTIGGQPRNRIAALDAVTGLATPWDPDADNNIRKIVVNGNTVYAGGLFSSVGGQSRNRIAALDAATGLASAWNPDANGNVQTIALDGNTVYTGGFFTSIGGQLRNRVAALDAGTGLATPWNPNANNSVYTIALDNGKAYIGGSFTSIGGQPRSKMAAIDPTTGLPSLWNPTPDSTIYAIEAGLARIYAGGAFTSTGGLPRKGLAVYAGLCTLSAMADFQADILCHGEATGQATVAATGGTGPYSYSWDTTPVQTAATATGLIAGTYTVTVTDANLCTTTQGFTITEPLQPLALTPNTTQTDVLCNGQATGSATVAVNGGTAPYSYLWNNGQTTNTITGLTAGTYTVTVTDANGCIVSNSFTITQPSALVATAGPQNNVLCFGNATGTATVNVTGGTGAYVYNWSPSGGTAATATGLAEGTYIVTVTDANLCQTTQSFIITQPLQPLSTTPNTTQTNVSCFAGANGTATMALNGGTAPYTYVWNNGQTTAIATGLAAGIYSVIATDANGCTVSQSFTITEPAALVATAGPQTNITCFGAANGSATVNATGGTGAYTYNWNTTPVQTTATATGLAPGTYTATVTDANQCQTTQSFTITQPLQPLSTTPNTIQTNVSCFAGSNGTATIAPNGGTAPYSYLWSNGQTTAMATGLTAGVYIVDVTDGTGCTVSQSFTITEPPALVAAAGLQSDVSCFGAANGSATVNVTGGTGAYSYSWNTTPVQTTATATGLAAGTYTVTVYDANQCQTTRSFTITQPAVVGGYFTVVHSDCHATGSATVHAVGGVGPYTYLWSNGNTTPNLQNALPGTYTVTITDANGCSNVVSTTINGTAPIVVISAPQSVTLNGGESVSFTVEALNATYYQWQVSTNGGASFTNLNAGGSLPTYYGVATPTLSITNAYSFIDGYLFRVLLMQQSGCYIVSEAATLSVGPVVVGIDDIKHLGMDIYPNPASTDVFVKIPDFASHQNIKLMMYDLNGRLVKNESQITSENYSMDVSGLESGIYIITIISDTARTDKKLIVTKKP